MKRQSRHSRTTAGSHALCVGLIGTFLTLLVSGCGLSEWAANGGKVGPNYQPPSAAVSNDWIDYQDPRLKSAQQDLSQWWKVFNDPTLNTLIEQAYDQNLNLRQAGERIMQARARRGIAVGNLFPQQQQAFGDFSHNKQSIEAANSSRNQWFQNWDAGFSASWELDLWGRFRRSIEAADADLDSSVADYDNVMVVLFSDVSATYIQYRTFQERIRYAQQNVQIQEKSYQLAKDKHAAGASTERDEQQAKQVLEQTRALIPQLEAGARTSANALCDLLGLPPRDLSQQLGPTTAVPSAPPEVALGIPADLLRRRPDIRRIERQAAAASALIGVAKSDLYPRFSILGTIGVQAENFGDLFKTPGSLVGSIGPSFRWDILNYGRIESNVAFQEARFRELIYAFQAQVLRAGHEAEDAAVNYLKSQERAKFLESSVAAAARTVEISYDQYRDGAIDFTPVFLFEGTLAQEQDNLAAARGQIALSLVDLYRALGGGWEMRLKDSATTQPSAQPATQPTARNAAATQPAVSKIEQPAARNAPNAQKTPVARNVPATQPVTSVRNVSADPTITRRSIAPSPAVATREKSR